MFHRGIYSYFFVFLFLKKFSEFFFGRISVGFEAFAVFKTRPKICLSIPVKVKRVWYKEMN